MHGFYVFSIGNGKEIVFRLPKLSDSVHHPQVDPTSQFRMQSLKFLFCITRSDTIGGAHVHVADMAAWLRGKGHEVVVVVGERGVYCDELRKRSIPYRTARHMRRSVSLGHDLLAVRELRRIFRDESPDLISLHSAKAGMLGRLAAAGLPSAVLFTAHGWSFTDGIPKRRAAVYRSMERAVARLTDKIITVSEYDRDLALRHGVGRPEQIVAVHNAMPDVESRANAGSKHEPIRLVMVARLDDQKDHRTLFAAIESLREKPWELVLVGDGPLEGELKQMAAASGISDRVRFLGLRNDVEAILAEGQIFLLISNWEGFPRSIIEAMRAGLPVIASDVGGVAEAVQDGTTGYVIAPKDAAALESRLRSLLDEPAERVRMGSQARSSYEARYRFERMANENLAVYRSILPE